MKLQAELSGVQKRLNYVSNRIVAYERTLKSMKSMMKFCAVCAIVCVMLLFLSPMIQIKNLTMYLWGIILGASIVFFPNLIGYFGAKRTYEKYKQERERIQGGTQK